MGLRHHEWTSSRVRRAEATHEDLATLCQSCGLCCDGSLFARVDLRPEEVEPARKRHLRVLENGKAFEQHCAAHAVRNGVTERRACAIYDHRPLSCRTFVCRLYERHRREGGPLAVRIDAVRRVRQLVAQLESAGLAPVDFEGDRHELRALGAAGERAMNDYAEIVRRLEDDFARA